MQRPRIVFLFIVALLSVGDVRAGPDVAALVELDEAQVAFHAYAPGWWNALSSASLAALGGQALLNSPDHLRLMARYVQLLSAAARANRDPALVFMELTNGRALDAAALAELPWPQALLDDLRLAHKTATIAVSFSAAEERAAMLQQDKA